MFRILFKGLAQDINHTDQRFWKTQTKYSNLKLGNITIFWNSEILKAGIIALISDALGYQSPSLRWIELINGQVVKTKI